MWSLPLLTAIAAATPLDEAAADGRPVVMLVPRDVRAFEAAIWLTDADGEARARLRAVSLVYAEPRDLAAWLEQRELALRFLQGPGEYALVRLSPARTIEAWAIVDASNVLDVAPPPSDGPAPGRVADGGNQTAAVADPSPTTRPRETGLAEAGAAPEHAPQPAPNAPELTHAVATRRAVVGVFDRALATLLAYDPSVLTNASAKEGAPELLGAVRCKDSGCGWWCKLPDPLAEEPPATVLLRAKLTDAFSCGMGHVNTLQSSFLVRWPP